MRSRSALLHQRQRADGSQGVFHRLFGLHESTAALDTMKEGVSKSIEFLRHRGKVQEAAVRSGYGLRSRRRRQGARRQRHQLSGAFARHRRRNARYGD